MLNRDAFFKKREDNPPRGNSNVNVTPALGTAVAAAAVDPATRNPAAMTALRTDAASPAERTKSGGSKLIVGPDIKLRGVEITDCDTLVVEGTVEASMDSRVVQIAENGVFNGTVSIDIAEIHGCFSGELTAREQLIIHAGGRVSGKIRYGRIKIEEGGELSGDIARAEARSPRSGQPALKTAATSAG